MAAHLTESRRERARVHFGVHAVLAFVALVVLGVPFALLVLWVREKSDWVLRVDTHVESGLHSFGSRHHAFVSTMRVVSDVGAPEVWEAVALVVAVLLWRAGFRRRAAFLVTAVVGGWLLNHFVKDLIGRARPHLPDAFAHAHGSSFPSGHAQAAASAVIALLVAGWPFLVRRLRPVLVAAAAVVVALICFSRVALGVHYVSDVVGGVVLGGAWALLMTVAFTAWQDEARGT